MRLHFHVVAFWAMISISTSYDCRDYLMYFVCYDGEFNQLNQIDSQRYDMLILNNFNGQITAHNLRAVNHVRRLLLNFGSNTDIQPQAFKSVPNLVLLSLISNNTNRLRYNNEILSGLNKLQALDLYGGLIENGAFDGLREIYRANFKNVDFPETLTGRVFGYLGKLEELSIWDSRLRKISEDAFNTLKNLRLLILNRVNLEYITPGAFYNLKNLENLDLAHNNLRHLSWSTFEGLSSLITVNFKDNPLYTFDGDDMVRNIPRITPNLKQVSMTCPRDYSEERKYLMDRKMRSLLILFYCSNI